VRRALAGRRFDALLHMHASARANLVSLLVRTQLRIGFDRARARDHQWLFTNVRLPARRERHVMDGLFEFAELIGVPQPTKPRWDIPVGAGDVAAIAPLFATPRPTLVISPCTGQRFRNYRNWRAASYAEVADYAARRYGALVLLTGGNTAIEHTYGREITATAKVAPRNLIGQTTLKQLLAILARASVVLCPDSGPAHMATAVGTPVVGLYATSNRHRTGPYFSQHLVVDKYPQAVEREFGRPIETLRWGQRVRDPGAMSLITAADVVAKLDAAFAERGIRPSG
jgi:heptosyltransferase I